MTPDEKALVLAPERVRASGEPMMEFDAPESMDAALRSVLAVLPDSGPVKITVFRGGRVRVSCYLRHLDWSSPDSLLCRLRLVDLDSGEPETYIYGPTMVRRILEAGPVELVTHEGRRMFASFVTYLNHGDDMSIVAEDHRSLFLTTIDRIVGLPGETIPLPDWHWTGAVYVAGNVPGELVKTLSRLAPGSTAVQGNGFIRVSPPDGDDLNLVNMEDFSNLEGPLMLSRAARALGHEGVRAGIGGLSDRLYVSSTTRTLALAWDGDDFRFEDRSGKPVSRVSFSRVAGIPSAVVARVLSEVVANH